MKGWILQNISNWSLLLSVIVAHIFQRVECRSCTCEDAVTSTAETDLIKLNVSEWINVCVCGQYEWSDTGIKVSLDEQYMFEVEGTQSWIDYQVTTTADGYSNKWIKLMCCDDQWLDLSSFESRTRVANAKWAALSCCAGRSSVETSACFVVGKGPLTKTIQILASAEDGYSILACFANDLMGLYADNAGALNVTITRVA